LLLWVIRRLAFFLQLTTKITSLPAVGTLYQISQIFSDYGYEPRRGLPITAASPGAPVVITGSRNRLLYVPPTNTNEPVEKVRTLAGNGTDCVAEVWNLFVDGPLCGVFAVSVEVDFPTSRRSTRTFRVTRFGFYLVALMNCGGVCLCL
jgi:hypothetical protein